MSFSKHYVLAAGGTGGHMIPAYALAKELVLRGHRVALITDERGQKIPGMVDEGQVHVLPAGRITKDPRGWLKGVRAIMQGRKMAMQLYKTFEPSAVVGFGGYPAFPALLAANRMNIPTIVHEQNAVLGRVNRLAARSVNAIATSYPDVLRIKPKYKEKVHLVGNPVRQDVIDLREEPYPPLLEEGVFRVLVTGAVRGLRSCRMWFQMRWQCCPCIFVAGYRSPSNAARQISSGYGRNIPNMIFRQSSQPICRIFPKVSVGHIWLSVGQGLRQSRS